MAFDGIDMDWDDDKLQEAAVIAYPEDAANIAQFLQAARQAKKLSELYAKKPWDGPPFASDGPTVEVNRELNRFFQSGNKVGKLQPHARV